MVRLLLYLNTVSARFLLVRNPVSFRDRYTDKLLPQAYLLTPEIKRIASDMGFNHKESIQTAKASFSEAKEQFPKQN